MSLRGFGTLWLQYEDRTDDITMVLAFIEMEGTKRPFPEESRLYTGSIFRPLLDSKTRIGSQGYVLSDDMVCSTFFLPAT